MDSDLNRLTLKQWFSRRAIQPLLALIFILLSIEAFHIFSKLNSYREIQIKRTIMLKDMLEIAFVQRDSRLIEKLMQSAYLEMDALFIGVCEGLNPIVTVPGDISKCPNVDSSFPVVSVQHLLLGTDRKQVIVRYNAFSQIDIFYELSFLVLLTFVFLIIIGRLIKNMKSEIIEPLIEDVFQGRDLKIKELIDVQRNFKAVQEAKKQEAVFEATIKLSNQVSHDIKSPLGAMEIALANLEFKKEESLKLAISALNRIKSILIDLETAKPNEEKIGKFERVDLERMIRDIFLEKEGEYQNQRIKFLSNIDQSVNLFSIFAIESDLKRIFSNLINNSVEAMDSDGRIVVNFHKNGNSVEIRVVDDGSGIDSEFIPKLFMRGSSFGKTTGSGLGLSYAREKISEWGGEIKMESTSGNGTVFLITFPLINS